MSKAGSVLIISLIVILALSHMASVREARAAATTEQPGWVRLWETQDLGGDVESLAFSPDGGRIVAAAGSAQRAVMISSGDGNVVWESQDLGSYVWAISYSPTGAGIAVGTGDGYVFILSPSDGGVLYQSNDLGPDVEWLAYSPDGARVAVGVGGYDSSTGAVALLTSTAREVWVKEFPSPIHAVAYSPDGSRIVAGGGNGLIVMLTTSGDVAWSSRVGSQVEGVAFSPGGEFVAVASCNIVALLNASTGGALWSRDIGSCAEPVAFSPDGSIVVVGTWDGDYIVFSVSDGEEIYRERVDDGVEAVSFSPDGGVVAMGTTDNYVLAVRVPVATAVIEVPGSPDLNLSVCFYSSSGGECYPLGEGGITVYAEPGTYRVDFVLKGLSLNVIGDINSLIGATVWSVDINVSPSSHYEIDPPEPTDFLGILKIDAGPLPGLNASISWGSGWVRAEIGGGQSRTYYAVPGTYRVVLTLSALPMSAVGDVAAVKPLTRVVTVGARRSITVSPSIEDFLGYIVLSAAQGAGIISANISWGSGSALVAVPAGDVVKIPAVPGGYEIAFTATYWPFRNWYPDAVIGPGTRYYVVVDAPGDVAEALFLVGKRPGGLLLESAGVPANVTVMWGGEAFSVVLDPNESVRLMAYPGEYQVIIEPAKPPDIGDPVPSLQTVRVEEGYITELTISMGTVASTLTLRGSDIDCAVIIGWHDGNKTLVLERDSEISLSAGPGTYTISFTPIGFPADVIGDTSSITPIKQGVTAVAGTTKVVDAPSLRAFLGELIIHGWSWPADAHLNISWGSGFRQYTLSPGSDLTLMATPGHYLVTVSVGRDVIGSTGSVTVPVDVYRGAAAELNLANTSLGSVGELVVRNNGTVPISANVTWGAGWVEFPLDPGASKELLAVPGAYEIRYRPLYEVAGFALDSVSVEVPPHASATADVGVGAGRIEVRGSSKALLTNEDGEVVWEGPGSTYVMPGDYVLLIEYGGLAPDVVGPVENLVINRAVTISAGEDIVIDADKEFLASLQDLIIEGPPGSVVKIEWGTGSYEVTIPADGVIRLKAVPGVEYTISSHPSDILHEDFTGEVYGGGYVTIRYRLSTRTALLLVAALAAGASAPVIAAARPRLSARLLTKEVVEGETESVEIEIRNKGMIGKRVRVEVEVCGEKAVARDLRLGGREAAVLRAGISWPCQVSNGLGVRVSMNGSTVLEAVIPVKVLREEVPVRKIRPKVPRVASDVIEDVRSLVTYAKRELSAGRVYEALDLLDEAVKECSGREEPVCSMATHLRKSIESVMKAVKSFRVVVRASAGGVAELIVRIEPPEDVPPRPPPIRAMLSLLPRGVKAVKSVAKAPIVPGKEVLLPLAVRAAGPGRYKVPVMVSWGNYKVVGRVLVKTA